MRKINILIMIMVAGLVSSAPAWMLLDNFEYYDNSTTTATTTATGGVWTSVFDGTANSNVIDFEDGQVLETIGGAAWRGAERDISGTGAAVTVGEVQTYFWQVRVTSTQPADATWDYDFMMGLSPDVSNIDQTNAWQDFAIMPFINNDAATPYINADAPTTPWWALMSPDTWYNVWVVIDNDAVDPTFALYYATDDVPILVHGDANWRNFGVNVDLNAIGFMAAGNTNCWYYIDNIYYAAGEDLTVPAFTVTGAYDPDAQPYHEGDGTVGTTPPVGGMTDVTLSWKAGLDPNEAETGYEFNPAILEHYVYWSATDANLPGSTLDGSIAQPTQDGNYTDPNITYGPVSMPADGSTIYWKVEEGLNDGTDSPYPAGDPNNIDGQVWTFVTVSNKPTFLTQPRPVVADPNATFTITASITADSYQWFKVVGQQDNAQNGETDDTLLTGETGMSLTIENATLADEAGYYCICYNGATSSNPSRVAWLVLPRLVGHWTLNGNMTDTVTSEPGLSGVVAHDGYMAYGDPNYVSEPDTDGFDGNGMRFYNDGQIMELPGEDFFNFYNDGFTLIYWYKQNTGANTNWKVTMSKFDIGNQGWLVGQAGANPDPDFIIEAGGVNADVGPLTDDQWNMVAVTYDADTDTFRLFSNGDENAQATGDLAAQPIPFRPVQIGGDDAGGTPFAIDAALSEIRMYSYPLTPTIIATMYTDEVEDVYVCVNEDEEFDAMDFNDDCRLNMADFSYVASEWLECQRIPEDSCDW